MNFDVSPFSRIRPIAFKLKPWTKPVPPKNQDNALRTVVNFARFVGLSSFPAKTTEKLKIDPYYKYCFYQLRYDARAYDLISENAAVTRARLKAILIRPELYNAKDLCLGLREYLNNFPAYFPGGYKSQYYQEDPGQTANRDIFEAVNTILGEKGKATALALHLSMQMEFVPGDKHAAYLKFCLGIFDILVQRYHFAPERLWG
jgi:hypothetical protein